MSTIGDNIRRVRTAAGLTQEEFGRIAGVSNMAVSQWENGRAVPRMGAVQAIADHLGINKGEIIDDAAPMPASPLSRRPVRAAPDARVPIRRLGRVHAGEADEEYEDDGETLVPAFVAEAHPKCFSVRVVGGCMDNVIPEGYDAVLDPEMEPRDRCIAVVEIEPGEAVMRRWAVTSRTLVLSCDSHTEEHDDIVLRASDSPRVVGVVVWAQRDMLDWTV